MKNVYCDTFNQTQPEYYGSNISESTEGIAVDNVFLKKIVQTNIYSYQNCSIFHSFMSDGSSKYVATTSSHTKKCCNGYLKQLYRHKWKFHLGRPRWLLRTIHMCCCYLHVFIIS